MEKYSKAVSEMYSQFEKREVHPMEKYVGRSVIHRGKRLTVVGYSCDGLADELPLIVDASRSGGWSELGSFDVVFKKCKGYWYVSINDLID